MPSPLPIPVASSLTDFGGVESGAVSASYSTLHPTTLTVDTSKITLPVSGLLFQTKNLFQNQNAVHLEQLFYSKDRRCYTQQISGIWKSWVSLEDLGVRGKPIISEGGKPAQLGKAAGCGGREGGC